jgi:hypothetical protein
VNDRIATRCEGLISSLLILLRASLITITRTLIVI